MNKKQRSVLARIIASSAMVIIIQFVPDEMLGIWGRLIAYLVPYLVIGHDILRSALHGIRHGQIFDENFLMAIATIGAIALALYNEYIGGEADYLEAVAVMLFYQIGELFQSIAVGKSRKNITALMDIRPDVANIERDGAVEQVDPDDVPIGSVIVVRPGEKVPIDGTVLSGESSLDTSALTGESVPRSVAQGDEIISGCVNLTGLLRIQTTKEFGESTVAKILDLVENAASRRSKPEDLFSRFARIYTPAVCAGAVAIALLPPVVRACFMELPADVGVWVYRALTFLVISCPCALVVSIPLTFFASIGGAGACGVLVKGSLFLDVLSRVKCIVLDKTGTLTQGRFEVKSIEPRSVDRDHLLELAAHAEISSSHPIAQSLIRAYGREPQLSRVEDVREEGGLGVRAKIDGVEAAVGSSRLMASIGIRTDDADAPGTVIHAAENGSYIGCIVVADTLKPTAKEAIAEMRKAGVQRIVMLTGDSRAAADAAAAELGITEHFCELLPADKVEKAEELMKSIRGGDALAFVGDGINDAPVLSRADVGIAMGALGSDAAIEAADIVLMDDDPLKISKAIKIARKCMSIVYQNIALALGIKFSCLALGAIGLANMWLAVFADVGVMVLAVMNAVRALFVKDL